MIGIGPTRRDTFVPFFVSRSFERCSDRPDRTRIDRVTAENVENRLGFVFRRTVYELELDTRCSSEISDAEALRSQTSVREKHDRADHMSTDSGGVSTSLSGRYGKY